MIKKWITDEGIYFIKTLIGAGLLMVLAVLLSYAFADTLHEKELLMVENEQLPAKALLEFIGLQQLQVFVPRLEIFFIALMVTNFIMIEAIIGHSVHSMRNSIEKGAFAFYYAQSMPAWQYYILVVIRVIGSALLAWSFYMAEVYLACSVLCKGLESDVVSTVQLMMGKMLFHGIPVVFLAVAIGVLYGIKQGYSMHGADFGLCLLGISFVIGNIYKIPQYIGHLQMEEMVNAQDIMNLAYQIKQIRFACPLAWLNPYNIYHSVVTTDVLLGYGLASVCVLCAAGVIFWKRNWWEV